MQSCTRRVRESGHLLSLENGLALGLPHEAISDARGFVPSVDREDELVQGRSTADAGPLKQSSSSYSYSYITRGSSVDPEDPFERQSDMW